MGDSNMATPERVPTITEAAQPQPEVVPDPAVVDAAAARAKRQEKLTAAYTTASKKLRDTYRAEFNQMMKAEAALLGEEWSPKLTAEEKAEADLRKILAEHPALRGTLNQM